MEELNCVPILHSLKAINTTKLGIFLYLRIYVLVFDMHILKFLKKCLFTCIAGVFLHFYIYEIYLYFQYSILLSITQNKIIYYFTKRVSNHQ
jgi:hypothetical protein